MGCAVKMSSTVCVMRDSLMVSPGIPLFARFWMDLFVDLVDCSTCIDHFVRRAMSNADEPNESSARQRHKGPEKAPPPPF